MHYGLKYQQSKQEFGNPFYRVSFSVCGEDVFPVASFLPRLPKVTGLPLSPSCHVGLSAKSSHKTPACKEKLKVSGTCPEESEEIPFLEYTPKIIKQGRLFRLPTRSLCVWEAFGRQGRLVYDHSGVHALQEGQLKPAVSFFWEAHYSCNQCRFFIKSRLIVNLSKMIFHRNCFHFVQVLSNQIWQADINSKADPAMKLMSSHRQAYIQDHRSYFFSSLSRSMLCRF